MKSLLITSIVSFVTFLPNTASAQGIFGGVCDGVTCSACDIAVIANSFISWLIGAVMVLFAVLMVMAGFGLVTSQGNPDALNTAKSKFINAIIGLIIVLSAWIMVDTLMRGLIGNNGQIEGYLAWSEIQCMTQVQPTVVSRNVGIESFGSTVTSAAESCESTPDGARILCDAQIAACDGNAIVDSSNSRNHTVSCERPVGIRDSGTTNTVCDAGPSGDRVLCTAQEASCSATGGTPVVNTSNPSSFSVDCLPATPTDACDTSQLTQINMFGRNVSVHQSIAAQFSEISAEWSRRGGDSFYPIRSVGTYNCRRVTGGSGYSVHAYGYAVDINPPANGYISPRPSSGCPTDMPAAFRQMFLSRGFGWGGNWRSACDTMHFNAASNEGGFIRVR